MATPDITPTKRCTKCGNEYPATAEYFGTRRDNKSGLRSECKKCLRIYHQEYHQTNIETAHERGREYSRKNADKIRAYRHTNADTIRKYRIEYYQSDVDKFREYTREYYRAHADQVRAKARERRKNNGDKLREKSREHYHKNKREITDKRRSYLREWHKNNPDKVKVISHRRRARKVAGGGTFTAADIERQRLMQTDKKGRLRCWWCSNSIVEYHIDHRIPLFKGGSNEPGNLCLACPKCNLSKGAKLPSEWNGRLI